MVVSTFGATAAAHSHVEDVEIRGHIIDSLLLPKILDLITVSGGSFQIKHLTVGHTRHDPSFALVQVSAASAEQLAQILGQIADHGAIPTTLHDGQLVPCAADGVFPTGFYSTTNQRTEIRLDQTWIAVQDQEMDCAIAVDPTTRTARCVAMSDVRQGELIVVGHSGVRVLPQERPRHATGFEFMGSSVSTEKPKAAAIREIAAEMIRTRQSGGRILIVGGPAIVHTGSAEHLCELIRRGYVQRLFAGNALATHDIEQALYGTSLGIRLDHGIAADAGHEHHLRAINSIRQAGGIAPAVHSGLLKSGIMYECVRHQVEFLLAGSIRDDGPLPDVITDVLDAQRQMRSQIRDVGFCLMVATALHSIAVGNLLPAWVKVACVDINPSTVIKLSDRGSSQTVGLVTDVEPFFRELLSELPALAHV
jgi:lysine-ketoglutarate reductase/saccharopine dehydrogenase-like protein (TIGR00300 family)